MKLIQLLERSAVRPAFRTAVHEFLSSGRPNGRVAFSAHSPPIKIERTLTKMLESYPLLPIEGVEIAGRSGCEFFRGTLTVRTASEERNVDFHWDCKWKASRVGWTDYFGFPDQTRAAREFGHDCFRSWDEEAVGSLAGA